MTEGITFTAVGVTLRLLSTEQLCVCTCFSQLNRFTA